MIRRSKPRAIELRKNIAELLEFVDKPSSSKKLDTLEIHLVNVYQSVLNLTDQIYISADDPQEIEYEGLRKNIEYNFKELGFYHTILNPQKVNNEPELAIGDAIDDLTEIIKDLKEVISLPDDNAFLWLLHFNFNSHFKNHLINLISYLNEFEK